MKPLFLNLALLSLAVGCGSAAPGGGAGVGDAIGDAVVGDGAVVDVGDGTTADADLDIHSPAVEKWWTCPTASGKAPQPLASCEQPDDGTYGCKRAFTGVVADGKSFVCNRCLGGDPKAQGRWRALSFDSEDPTRPLPGGRRELLVVDGNTWHLHARSEVDGVEEEVRVDGWYVCADPAELKSEHIIFLTTAAVPQDALGWFAPDTFTGEFLTKGGNLLAWGLNAGFERDWIGYVNYCKIGTMVGGKPCEEPFSAR